MTDLPATVEKRPVPDNAALVLEARRHPGSWVYDIDWNYPPEQRVPPEAIRGSWEVDGAGRLTGNYAVNPRYRPIQRISRGLKPFMHAGARRNPKRWIVEMDPRAEHLFPDIPETLIRGWWYVDATGTITDQFRENSRWAPPDQ